MASHVVVIDSTARRATVKVTPTKHLTEVLGEACSKLHVNPTQYGLKHQKKQLDLSLSIRLSGLSSGAKLELVQLSRSPSVVSIALQLPESEAQNAPSGRLIDKFPSNTTLWLVLRKFESGVAGNGTTRNLTARGAPKTEGSNASGRLYYQTPVIQLIGKELSSFTDLQKTLLQLGLNSGSALLRLSFRTTDRPLEEAMSEIEAYFKSVDEESEGMDIDQTPPVTETPSSGLEEATPKMTPHSADSIPESPAAAEEVPVREDIPDAMTESQPQPPAADLPQPVVSSRPVTVFAPPSNTTPQSAQRPRNENDYIPTVEHAKAHQRRLNTSSRPQRLAGDAELAAQESAVQKKLSKIDEIEVKIRFPDQSQVVSKFTRDDTAQSLYSFVRSCLDAPLTNEQFTLSFFSSGPAGSSQNGQTIIPDSPETLLIKNLRMNGRVLVNFLWKDNAALSSRSAGSPILRPDLRQVASQIKVEEPAAVPVGGEEEGGDKKSWLKKLGKGGEGKKGGGSGGVPKWLKLPGKK